MSDVLCRTCLCWKSHYCSVLDYCEDASLHIYEIVMSFCQVQIKPNDGLPGDICTDCLDEIKRAYSFKVRCEKSYSILNQNSITIKCDENKLRNVHETHVFIKTSDNCSDSISNIVKIEKDPDFDSFDDTNCGRIKEEMECKETFTGYGQNLDVSDENEKGKKEISIDVNNCDNSEKNIIRTSKSINNLKTKSIKKKFKKCRLMIKCLRCDFKTRTASRLRAHMKTHTGEKSLSCNLCNFKCVQSSSLRIHKLTHTNEKPYICTFCDYKSSNSSNLKRHIRTHTNDKPYCCNICTYKCAQPSCLKEHLKLHSGEKPYLCDQCHYTCRSSTALKTHKMNVHSLEKRFSCSECDFRAKTKNTLLMHERTHSGIKSFSCEICSYKAFRQASLDNHKMMAHSTERPFACDECSYRCVNADYLKRHKRSHLTVRMFSCDVCPYSCNTKHRLKIHKMTHTGEKPYHCNLCDYKCSKWSSFNQHKKSHTSTPSSP